MTLYCMEVGTERDDAVVHKVSCGSFDLGTLIGSGNVCRLGDFATSELALDEARKCHENAVRCVDCCITDLIPHDVGVQTGLLAGFEAKTDLYRGVGNVVSSIRDFREHVMPDLPLGTTTGAVELYKDKRDVLTPFILA